MVNLRMFALPAALTAAFLVACLCVSPTTLAGETVLLDFTASWCSPCQTMQPTIHRLAQEGLPVRKVDFDQQRELANRYGVTNVPTFVMVVDGKEVDRVVGATGYRRLKQMFDRARVLPPGAGNPRMLGQSPGNNAATNSPPPRNINSRFTPSLTPPPSANHLSPNASGIPTSNALSIRSGSPTETDLLVQSSVRIRVEDAAGHSFGTGTIIDTRSGQALILTCGHIFRDSNGKGPISVDLYTSGSPTTVQGNLIEYDLDLDLALISIQPGQPVRATPVAGPGYSVTRGQSVTNIGCNNGQNPTARKTQVTQIDRYAGAPNVEAAGAPVQGRSGGGLFDSEGRLIGVCFAADEKDDEGLYSAAASIHSLLDRHGLSDIYRRTPAATANIATLADHTQPAVLAPRSVVAPRSDVAAMPRAMPTPSPSGSLATATATPAAPYANRVSDIPTSSPIGRLTDVEAAALSEIQARSQDAEVICIIRPKDPNAKSEVIVLDSASRQFIERLNAARRRSTPQLTSMQVPRKTSYLRPAESETERRDAVGWERKPLRR